MIDYIKNKLKKNLLITKEEVKFLVNYNNIKELSKSANEIKGLFFGQTIELCSIVNLKSGRCSEDCKFCAQSAFYNTHIKIYDFLGFDKIKKYADYCKSNHVKRLCIGTSGKKLDNIDRIIKAIETIKKKGLLVDATLGITSRNDLIRLKEAGLDGFHHNLETSERYFPYMCTTHKYKEDIETVENAKDIGLFVCSGCIFGIGETWEDRVELALLLKKLDVDSIPINFLSPIKGTPYEKKSPLSEWEALKVVAIYRFLFPDKYIRICGGRNVVFNDYNKSLILKSGANGIMAGNYLTLKGFDINSDLTDIKNASLIIL